MMRSAQGLLQPRSRATKSGTIHTFFFILLLTLQVIFCLGTSAAAAPSITSLTPTSAAVGVAVTIRGTNFGTTQGASTVTFNGTTATPTTWANTSIKVPVPAGATTGNVVVTVNGVASNGFSFTVLPTPGITSLTPGSGPVGAVVTVAGSNFGATQGTSTVVFNKTTATPTLWSDSSIQVPVPVGATTGNVVVKVNGVASNGFSFTVLPTPNITNLTPSSDPVGSAVTIAGTNFGTTQGASTVTFNGTTATPTTWANASIKVPVPAGATTGSVVVTVNGVPSNGFSFTVLPTPSITSLAPGSGPVGAVVTIAGINFGATQNTSTVVFNKTTAAPTVWSDSSIQVPVPVGATTGIVVVKVNGVASNGFSFTVLPTPNITNLTPGSDPVGAVVTIAGTNFGTTQGAGTVTFNGITATPTTWGNTSIKVPVPAGATTGNVVVTVNGVPSNGFSFTVLPTPSITSLTPGSGPVGAVVTIAGISFGAAQGASTAVFNKTTATPTVWSDSSIHVPVPVGATTGNVVVKVNGVGSNGFSFTVQPTPSITSLTPATGAVGVLVTIKGANFGASRGTSTVTFNTAPGTPTTWANTSIKVPVPAGATTGNVVVTVNGAASNGVSFTVPGTTLNTSRYQHSATLLNNGKVLIAGGVTCPTAGSCTYLNSAELYDPTAGSAATTGSLGTARVAPSVLLTNGKVLIAGGANCNGSSCASLASVEIYDPASGTFASAGNLQVARDGHTMTLLADGKVLIAGGETCSPSFGGGSENRPAGEPLFDGARLVNASFTPITGSISCSAQGTAEIYDPTTGTFAFTNGSLNTARYNAAAVRLADGRVLIVGGSDESRPLWSAEIYEESASSFKEIPSGLGTARSSPVATLLNSGLVLITGGSTCEVPICPTNTVELYDPTANTFQYTSGAMTVSRVGHTAELLTNGQLVLAGGNSSCPQSNACIAEASTETYDPVAGTFSAGQAMASARSGHTGTLLSNGKVLLTGGIAGGTTLASIDFYQPSTLAPPNLASIAVTPATVFMVPGGIQQFVATGTFSDGSTSPLESVAWGSSSSTVASINNAASSPGFAFGLSFGTTTITATTGTVSGSATLTVRLPVQSGGLVNTSGPMSTALYGQSATQLTTGQLLIAGGISTSGVVNGAELYTPANQTFTAANAMNVARWLHTATLLNDGTVLIAGGSDLANKETLDTAEIYNPTSGTFTLLSSTLNTARVGHTATLLNNGQVLIAGGYDPSTGLIADAELYDPPTQTFTDLGDMNAPRYQHTATALPNGQVLIAGGDTDPIPSAAWNTAEIFDLPTQTFTPVPVPMVSPREGHAAVLLNDGQVLISGGDVPGTGSLNTAETYDPASNTFAAVVSLLTVPRILHSSTLLNGGKVLLVGGATDSGGSSTALYGVELYDPSSQTFTTVGDMASPREHHTASLLNDGTVLVAGGTDGTNIFSTAELYTTSLLSGLTSIAITPPSSSIGAGAQQRFTAVGTFSGGSTQTLASVLWSSSSAATAPISADVTNPGVAASGAQGTTTIAASAAGVSGSTTLTVTAPTLTSITLSPQNATIPLGATQQFTATAVYTDGSTQDLTATATWSSSATVVATINSSGLAVGFFQGTATVQVNVGSVSASTALSVGTSGLISIAVNPATATLALGSSQQYHATGTYSDGSTQDVTSFVSWSSATSTVATVSGTGLVAAVSQGSTTITATFGSIVASSPLTVGAPSLASLSVAPDAASLSTGATQQLTATGMYTDGTTQNLTASSTWVSSNSNTVSVNATGLATAVVAGNATITATFGSTSGTAALVVTTGTRAANLNASRYQHSATILNNGTILVAGGITCPTAGSCTYLNSAEVYDPASSSFTNTNGAMATVRSAPSVQLNNGKVLVAGGYTCDGTGNCTSLGSAEIYDPASGTFSNAGTLTVPRSGHTLTVLPNGTVLIAGGENCTAAASCSALFSAEIYDPVAGTFTATLNNMTAPRFGASAVLLNSGSVLIAGGFDGTNLPAAAEIYNPTYFGTSGGFTGGGPSLNTPRFDDSATLLNNGQVLVAGGSTCDLPGCPTNAAEIYDPVASTFTLVSGGMNVSRFNHSATLIGNGDVVVAGGYSACASSCTSEASTEFFDPVAGIFTSGQAVASAVAGHTGTLLANGNVLLIGGINAGVTQAVDEWYQPTSFTPAGLVSVTVAPASLFLMPGQTQKLVATGTFNDASTQTLQSVIWNSSNPSAAGISNSPGSGGVVNAQTPGTTTLTATAGDVGGSALLNVAALTSLTLAPVNPTVTVGVGQQITATANYSDGSTQNLTTSVVWTSSSTSAVLVGTTSPVQGLAMGIGAGTATVTATFAGVSASTSVTVQAATVIPPPNITSVSPSSGVAGTQVTVSGSNFGATQGTGTLWLGSTYGAVVSWSNTQIVATVSLIAQSGIAQVQQGGVLSNSMPFNVSTVTISTVFPASGLPGTQVVISGSGFGATQNDSQLLLGTANGVVQSWSDSLIIAEVAIGSLSGYARVLQNGITSNAVPFTVNLPHITGITPNSGTIGTFVTINGSGFGGATQCSGSGGGGGGGGSIARREQATPDASPAPNNSYVLIGGTQGSVTSWCSTKIVISVPAGAMTGVIKVNANGIWSNAVSFTVISGGPSVTLVPNFISMVVGETRTLDAVDSSGLVITGLIWSSSNTAVATLSTDDPPIITAVAPGTATITAGNASADLTVYSGPLPPGTTIWTNPGDGSGVLSIVPAIPSATGVADVFVLNGDCNVQAVTSSGSVAWTANIGEPPEFSSNTVTCNQFFPDFQGGIVVKNETSRTDPNGQVHRQYHVQKLDGMTGQGYPTYDMSSIWWMDLNFGPPAYYDVSVNTYSSLVVHPDGTIFTVDSFGQDINGFGGSGQVDVINPLTGTAIATLQADPSGLRFAQFGNWIIAGDGYAYIPYTTGTYPYSSFICGVVWQAYLRMLRVGTDGSATFIPLQTWDLYSAPDCSGPYAGVIASTAMTNADQGVVVSWLAQSGMQTVNQTTTSSSYNLAITNGTSVIAQTATSNLVTPVLQGQDGTFYGTDANGNMVHFDQSANITWSVPGEAPRIATADGGVTGVSGIAYDGNGKAIGPTGGSPVESWAGNGYVVGVSQVAFTQPAYASSFAAVSGGNPTAASPGPQNLLAPSHSSGPYSIEETMYMRSFAPWQWFGSEAIPPCSNNCFRGDDRTFSTSLTATARITGIFKYWMPGGVLGDKRAFSDPSYDIYGRTKTALPSITTSNGPNGYTFHMEFAGANPLIIPQALSPDINTKLDFTPVWNSGQICYAGHLYGDAFPNAEVFTINSKTQATMLLTFATEGDPNTGPPHYLPGNNSRDMGSFSNICVEK